VRNALPLLLALTLVTGYVDALAFIGFNHVFSANMSGNTILLGITLVQLIHPLGIPEGPSGHLIAIASFAAGAAAAVLYLRKPELTRKQTAFLVGSEALLVLVGYFARHVGFESLVALAAAAGAQSVLAVKAGIPGISTTYVSGTIVHAMSDAMNLRDAHHLIKGATTAAAWAAYGAGAALGALGFWALHESALLVAAGAFLAAASVVGATRS
jgi:uncharacterized membrane protein YoaK (UPF0700 family)